VLDKVFGLYEREDLGDQKAKILFFLQFVFVIWRIKARSEINQRQLFCLLSNYFKSFNKLINITHIILSIIYTFTDVFYY